MAPIRSRSRHSRTTPAALKVVSVDLLKQDNQPKHHTSEYEVDELVVRRGAPFTLLLTLSRALNENEILQFELRMGGRPMVSHGSLVNLPKVDVKPNDNLNGYKILAAAGDVLTIEIHTKSDIAIGQWDLAVRSYRNGRRGPIIKVADDIIVIFNPWHKSDQVYMANEAWRNEYVLNENGMQFYGSALRIGSMDWYFGQFEPEVMKASLKLLHMGDLRYRDHSDPVMVSRHLSGLVNANDDDGVLVGNWSGDYDDGKSPTDWNGSVAILKQFVDSGESVKYGQCWVFSGVLTSVLRCLGIPARSLTTFESAHDTDGNLTIDYHFDENGKPEENDDSIWNFHVWNDAWMARPNLPEGLGGWQAVDATPQEESQGKFQCGPASVAAVKQGQIDLPYDAPFLYAEVNGTKKYWQKLKKPEETEDGRLREWEELSSDTASIGQHISTKAIGAFKREDITLKYKYAEGTPEEAISFEHARKFVKLTKVPSSVIQKLVEFQPSVPVAVRFGSDVTVKLRVKNISKKTQTVFLSMVGKVMQYNGAAVADIFDRDFSKDIGIGRMEEFSITLPYKAYGASVKGTNSIKAVFLGGVRNSKQTYAGQSIVEFDKPSIKIEIPSSVRLLKPVKAKVSFTNPLSVALEGGEFRLEGAGLKDAVKISVPTIYLKALLTPVADITGMVDVVACSTAPSLTVKPNAVCSVDVSVVPRKLGSRRILAGFYSKQLDGLRGSVDVRVV